MLFFWNMYLALMNTTNVEYHKIESVSLQREEVFQMFGQKLTLNLLQ